MAEWLTKHWTAFWHSGPENHYTFIWWTIDAAIVAAFLSLLVIIASHFGWLFPKLETFFLYLFVAFAASAFLGWVAQSLPKRFGWRSVKGQPAKRPIPPETMEADASTAMRPVREETKNPDVERVQPPPLVSDRPQVKGDPELAGRCFNRFNPPRPMNDLVDSEWIALGTLYSTYVERAASAGRSGRKII